MHNAVIISKHGKSKAYAPTLNRNDEPTRMFAAASKDFVSDGGISVVFSSTVTPEALTRLRLILDAHEQQLRAIAARFSDTSTLPLDETAA